MAEWLLGEGIGDTKVAPNEIRTASMGWSWATLPGAADWQAYEDARQALFPNLSRSEPAAPFGVRRASLTGSEGTWPKS